MSDLKYHNCQLDHDVSHSWRVYDNQNIYLCRVCKKCEREKLSQFRPEIIAGYNQQQVDEPIEPEGSLWW